MQENQESIYVLFEKLANGIPKSKNGERFQVSQTGRFKDTLIGNKPIIGFKLDAIVTEKRIEVAAPVIIAYGNPTESFDERSVIIEESNKNEIELVHSDKNMLITLDFSNIIIPIDHYFRGIGWRVGRGGKAKIQIIGLWPERKVTLTDMVIGIEN